MAKLRGLLALVMSICAVLGYEVIYSGWPPTLIGAVTVVTGILFFVAISIFVLSFLTMEITPEGELSYDRCNLFWSLLEEGNNGKPFNNLCQLYWSTVGFVFGVCFFVGFFLFFIFMVGSAFYNEPLISSVLIFAVLAVVGLVCLAFNYVPPLGTTLVGQMIVSTKKSLCPKIAPKSR